MFADASKALNLPLLGMSLLVVACSDDAGSTGPPPVAWLSFAPVQLELGESRSAVAAVRNTGTASSGPVVLTSGPILDDRDQQAAGASILLVPDALDPLSPGASRNVELTLLLASSLPGGSFRGTVDAQADGQIRATLTISFLVPDPADGPASIEIVSVAPDVVQGSPVHLTAEVRDRAGEPLPDAPVSWQVLPTSAGFVDSVGRFVGYEPGPARVRAASGAVADTADFVVAAREIPTGTLTVVGQAGIGSRITTDHWEWGTSAYVATMGCSLPLRCGVFAFDITNPAAPVLTDSLLVAAGRVNDVKIRDDGTLGVLTHEQDGDPSTGAITVFDLSDPLHPAEIITWATPDLAPGVHNVWIDGDHVYVAVDGNVSSAGLRVVDISNPAAPVAVASFYAGSSNVHDVYVRDGLAFVSHWDAGLVILDVGHGIAGGSPSAPVEVSRIDFAGSYAVHNAWYWPEAGYVLVGDEFDVPGRGFVKVVDVSDLSNPVEVASYAAAGAAPHNFWVDEERAIAYFAWYENGVHAVDVSGQLLGELDRQNRRITDLQYAGPGTCGGGGTCTWAPQLHDGRIFVSDLHSGLWVLEIGF